MITLYNTLSRKKEEFKPIEPNAVKFYMCGPTVYDFFHVGNARSFVMSDMIRRYLAYRGFDVTFAMNLTDVEDKIIRRANEENQSAKEIADRYADAFFEDAEKLKIRPADSNPRPTEHMDEIVAMIERLVENGYAYEVGGNVFYDVAKFEGYGKLSGKKLDELEAGSRVEVNKEKRNPLDFALWKKAKPGEPKWRSPWSEGRPGWHIECSAMSCARLGETFDVHAGGSDLIFPHHENEIAQSEGANGKPFVNYWLHFGFLNIDDEKMSKSLGNFFTARDVLDKYSAASLRFFFAQTHYRSPLNFSSDGLDAARAGLEKLRVLAEKLKRAKPRAGKDDFDVETHYARFNEACDDDFNFPKGFAVLFDFARDVNRRLAQGDPSETLVEKAGTFLREIAEGVFGVVDFSEDAAADPTLETELIEFLIELRAEAKREKNYALADRIRDGLAERGVRIEDGKSGVTYRKTDA
jgi:cysteinyl-tRNA synthetase